VTLLAAFYEFINNISFEKVALTYWITTLTKEF